MNNKSILEQKIGHLIENAGYDLNKTTIDYDKGLATITDQDGYTMTIIWKIDSSL